MSATAFQRLLVIILFTICGIHTFADPPPDPSKLENSVKVFLGKKTTLQFQVDGNTLKNPVIAEHVDKDKPSVTVYFEQVDDMVILHIISSFPKVLRCQCMARLKGQKTYFLVDLNAIMANGGDVESWGDPIEEFILFDFKLTDEKL